MIPNSFPQTRVRNQSQRPYLQRDQQQLSLQSALSTSSSSSAASSYYSAYGDPHHDPLAPPQPPPLLPPQPAPSLGPLVRTSSSSSVVTMTMASAGSAGLSLANCANNGTQEQQSGKQPSSPDGTRYGQCPPPLVQKTKARDITKRRGAIKHQR